jgi:hypothetical protein
MEDDGTEHRPPRGLVALMAVFVAALAAAALGFWAVSLFWPGGPGALAAALPRQGVAIFGALHIPAAVAGLLLWQWRRTHLRPALRIALEAAVLYFWAVLLAGIFFNHLAASFLARFS